MNKQISTEIREKSHLREVTDLARQYFTDSGIEILDLQLSDFERLKQLIQIEIDKLLADSSYQMVKDLKMHHKIEKNKYRISLNVSGSYFSKREAITFNSNGFIGFCGWASGCNITPFILGFCNWIGELRIKQAK